MPEIYLHDTFWQDWCGWIVIIGCLIWIAYGLIKWAFRKDYARTKGRQQRCERAWDKMNTAQKAWQDADMKYTLQWLDGEISRKERTDRVQPYLEAYKQAEAEWYRAGDPDLDITE